MYLKTQSETFVFHWVVFVVCMAFKNLIESSVLPTFFRGYSRAADFGALFAEIYSAAASSENEEKQYT